MRNRTLVETAQSLHLTGLGIRKIAHILHQDSTQISRWCRKATILNTLKHPITRQEKDRHFYYTKDNIKLNKLDMNSAKILLATLYWCEGAKYPGTNRIEFVSSDEDMQAVFIRLMRKVFSKELIESKFRVMLQLHTTHDISSSIQYWSKILEILANQFVKPHITFSQKTRYRHIYNGTCSLRYQNYQLLLRLMGIYNRIAKQLIGGVVKRFTTTVY